MSVSGILSINKPAGWTSFDVVALVRKRTGVRNVGHAGALDPSATGVLLVCLGQAVRISEYLMQLSKVYRARVMLGVATDTYDSEGQVTFEGDAGTVSEERLREALARFAGEVEQTPPAFSAVKVGGQRAYKLARMGRETRLSPRMVRVDRIELVAYEPPYAELEVECGKGTYIRSLAHDLGQELGCGAHLAALTRTRVGPFVLERAVSPQEVEEAVAAGRWQEMMYPMAYGLDHLPAVVVGGEEREALRHGGSLRSVAAPAEPGGGPCRAETEDGELLAIVKYDAEAGVWRPQKVFTGAADASEG